MVADMSLPGENDEVIVLENRNGTVKRGTPMAVFPNMVGLSSRYKCVMPDVVDQKDVYVGDEAQLKRYPLIEISNEVCRVTDWDHMEKIWHHTFHSELCVNTEDHPVLFTEAPWNGMLFRRTLGVRCTVIVVVGLVLIKECAHLKRVLSTRQEFGIYDLWQERLGFSSIVVDSGDGVSDVVPVYEGYAISNAVNRLDLAGRDISEHLRILLFKRRYNFERAAGLEIVREIKEKRAYVCS
ncbi:actin [Tanacetum coccineum]